MHRARAHAGLEARAEIDAEPVRLLMVQRGDQTFAGVHGGNAISPGTGPQTRKAAHPELRASNTDRVTEGQVQKCRARAPKLVVAAPLSPLPGLLNLVRGRFEFDTEWGGEAVPAQNDGP